MSQATFSHPINHDERWVDNPLTHSTSHAPLPTTHATPPITVSSLSSSSPSSLSSSSALQISDPIVTGVKSFEGANKLRRNKKLVGVVVAVLVLAAVTAAVVVIMLRSSSSSSSGDNGTSSSSTTTTYSRGLSLPSNAQSIISNMSTPGDLTRSLAAMPTSLDWRTATNVVSAMKNQGGCGDCWAFSAISTMESAYGLKYGTLPILSAEQLVDCDLNDDGCDGGWQATAWSYYGQNGAHPWAVLETAYPYKMSNPGSTIRNTCTVSDSAGVMSVTSQTTVVNAYTWSQSAEDTVMAWIAQYGPVAISVDASTWDSYQSGVVTSTSIGCSENSNNIDHAVAIVGWGVDSSAGNYWIVRNQWGSSWGESGYIRLARGANTCCVLCFVMAVSVAATTSVSPTFIYGGVNQTITFTALAGASDVIVALFPTAVINPSLNGNVFPQVVMGGWSNTEWAIQNGQNGASVCSAAGTLQPAKGTGNYYVTVLQPPTVSQITITAGYIDSSNVKHPVISNCVWGSTDPRTLEFFALSSYGYKTVYSNIQGVTVYNDTAHLDVSGVVTVPADYTTYLNTPVFRLSTPYASLSAGYSLAQSQQLTSADGRTALILRSDGNLVITQNGNTVWATGIYGLNTHLVMGTNCNLVLYNTLNKAVWSTSTTNSGTACANSYVIVQNDGNVVVYEPSSTSSTATVLWQSSTGTLSVATTTTPTTAAPTTATPTTKTPSTAKPTTATATTATATTATATTATATTATATTAKATTAKATTAAATTATATAAATTAAVTTAAATTAKATAVATTAVATTAKATTAAATTSAAHTTLYIRSLGCFTDNATRVLPNLLSSVWNYTAKDCAVLANSYGYAYYGLEYYGQCWAGPNATYNRIGASTVCNYACTSNASQTCGGYWAITAYQILKSAVNSTMSVTLSAAIPSQLHLASKESQKPKDDFDMTSTCTYYNGSPSFCWRCVNTVTPAIQCMDATAVTSWSSIDLHNSPSLNVHPSLCPQQHVDHAKQICQRINYHRLP